MAEQSSSGWWFDQHAARTKVPAADSAQAGPSESDAQDSSSSAGGINVGALLTGAQQLMEWASELVLAPHADHADPAEHPECLMCKGQSLIASPAVQGAIIAAATGASNLSAPFAGSSMPQQGARPAPQPSRPVREPRTITWIPVTRRAMTEG